MRKCYVLTGTYVDNGRSKTFVAGVFSSLKKASIKKELLNDLDPETIYVIQNEIIL